MNFYVVLIKADASTPSLQAQIEALAGQPHEAVEVLEPYGMTVNPDGVEPTGLLGIGTYLNQNADSPVVLGWLDKTHRPKDLEAGEVCFYSKHGQTIKFDKDGQIVLTDASGSTVTMAADGDIDLVPSSGNVRVTGTIRATGDVLAGTVSLVSHLTTNVQPGGGLSGVPQQ